MRIRVGKRLGRRVAALSPLPLSVLACALCLSGAAAAVPPCQPGPTTTCAGDGRAGGARAYRASARDAALMSDLPWLRPVLPDVSRRRQVAETSSCARPYDPLSPWNTPIPAKPSLMKGSAAFVQAIADNGLPLTSDVDQYTIAVYTTGADTPLRTIKLSGWFSSYDAGDNSRVGYGFAPTISAVPIPRDASPAAGSDGQMVFWDPRTGVEYGFWRFTKDAAGNYTAQNGYRYHTVAGYHGRFADGKAGRGAGLPYLAGLVRPCEFAQGRIEHALAFAYKSPSRSFVYPASKSDGLGVLGVDIPEGARLQLDPALGEADFDRWGLSREARVVARALQTYGMYVVDTSGSSKLFVEARQTAGWGSSIGRDLVSRIPWAYLRVVAAPPAP